MRRLSPCVRSGSRSQLRLKRRVIDQLRGVGEDAPLIIKQARIGPMQPGELSEALGRVVRRIETHQEYPQPRARGAAAR